MDQLTREDLDAGLDHVLLSGTDTGRIEMVVSRPEVDERIVLDEGELIIGEGLAGDNYLDRGIEGAGPHPEAQLTLVELGSALFAAQPIAKKEAYTHHQQ